MKISIHVGGDGITVAIERADCAPTPAAEPAALFVEREPAGSTDEPAPATSGDGMEWASFFDDVPEAK